MQTISIIVIAMNDFIIFCAKYLIGVLVLLAAYGWLRLPRKTKTQFVVAFIITGIISVILAKLAGKLYYHPRPFVVEHIKPLVSHSADNGFPSEHSVLAGALTVLLYFYRRNLFLAALALAILVGLGRIWAHVHSPLDIAAGLVFGAIAGWLGFLLATKFYPTSEKPKPVSARPDGPK